VITLEQLINKLRWLAVKRAVIALMFLAAGLSFQWVWLGALLSLFMLGQSAAAFILAEMTASKVEMIQKILDDFDVKE